MTTLQRRVAITALNLLLFAALVFSLMWGPPPEQPAPWKGELAGWAPPTWHPRAATLEVLRDLEGPAMAARGPRSIEARGAIVADLDRGEVLWAKAPDTQRSIASVTKVVSALAATSLGADFEQTTCVTPDMWPGMRGARSKFETGVCHVGWDFLGAALVSSDNRGAMAMPVLSDVSYEVFLSRMHEISRDLRMDDSSWADPSGVEDENMSTPRDVLKALVAASEHPDVARAASAPTWQITRRSGPFRLGSTNRLVQRFDTLAAKTGFTSTAGWCFGTIVQTSSGSRLVAVVLGSRSESSRFADASKLLRWADAQQL